MKKIFVAGATTLLLLLIFGLSLQSGIVHLHHWVFSIVGKSNSLDAITVWQVRFPRVLAALLIGAALGVAGGLAQAIFRNPLAEPTLIGLSSGATLGTIAAITTGAAAYGSFGSAAIAVIFALTAALLVQMLTPHKGSAFLLMGLALSSVLIAIAGLLIVISAKPGVQSLAFWNFGSLTLVNFATVKMVLPFIIAGLVIAMWIAPQLDIYSLGESTSHFIGINPSRVRLLSILAMSLLVGSSVSAVGSIAFLGLLVPHIVRLLIGPSHRTLLLFSALIGATLLALADFLARSIAAPHEIPLGLLTSILGAPLLIALIRTQRTQWVDHD